MKTFILYFYLILAIVGGGFTFYYILVGLQENHWDFSTLNLIQSTWTENAYSKSITLDFWTSAVAGTFFVLIEGLRLKIKYIPLYLLTIIGIGFAFGFPLFLYVRQRLINKP